MHLVKIMVSEQKFLNLVSSKRECLYGIVEIGSESTFNVSTNYTCTTEYYSIQVYKNLEGII